MGSDPDFTLTRPGTGSGGSEGASGTYPANQDHGHDTGIAAPRHLVLPLDPGVPWRRFIVVRERAVRASNGVDPTGQDGWRPPDPDPHSTGGKYQAIIIIRRGSERFNGGVQRPQPARPRSGSGKSTEVMQPRRLLADGIAALLAGIKRDLAMMEGNMSRYRSVLKTPLEVRDALRARRLTMAEAVKIAALDEGGQAEIARRLRDGGNATVIIATRIDLPACRAASEASLDRLLKAFYQASKSYNQIMAMATQGGAGAARPRRLLVPEPRGPQETGDGGLLGLCDPTSVPVTVSGRDRRADLITGYEDTGDEDKSIPGRTQGPPEPGAGPGTAGGSSR